MYITWNSTFERQYFIIQRIKFTFETTLYSPPEITRMSYEFKRITFEKRMQKLGYSNNRNKLYFKGLTEIRVLKDIVFST